MGLQQWLSEFRALHERARRGDLDATERETYREGREALARALVAAQRLTRSPDQSPRQAVRVTRALQVVLESRVRRELLVTVDLSLGGFSAAMGSAPGSDEELTATLRLPETEPFVASARVVGVAKQPGRVLVSFAFGRTDDASRERLELALFDTILAQVAR